MAMIERQTTTSDKFGCGRSVVAYMRLPFGCFYWLADAHV